MKWMVCDFTLTWWWFMFGWLCLFTHDCTGVEIRRLSVPKWLQNGTESAVVLDCEYVYTETDYRLVVKWFYEDNTEPVYQWIPELNRQQTSGILKNRLDLNYTASTVDAYSKYRAMKILRPTTELTGKYTCLVTSLAGQDSREQTMTVYVPAHDFELGYTETNENTVNVTCETVDVYPYPKLMLSIRPNSLSPPLPVVDVKTHQTKRPSGSYDVLIHRSFVTKELSPKGATVFECMLELPGTNYFQSKRIAYFPGIQGGRLESPHGLSSLSPALPLGIISSSLLYSIITILLHKSIYKVTNFNT